MKAVTYQCIFTAFQKTYFKTAFIMHKHRHGTDRSDGFKICYSVQQIQTEHLCRN